MEERIGGTGRTREQGEAKKAWRVKATCRAKTTQLTKRWTRGGKRSPPRSCMCVRIYGTPVFQSRDKDEARKGGLHEEKEARRKRGERHTKEVRKPKVEEYRRKVSVRHDMQAKLQ